MNARSHNRIIEWTEQELLPQLAIRSEHPGEPIRVDRYPQHSKLLGAGNYAAVFVPSSDDMDQYAVKVYAPGREGWEEEVEVYRRIGDHPAYSCCFHAAETNGVKYLVLRRLSGKTLYNCILEGELIPERAISDIDEALDYARSRGLHPHDVHGKNVMVSGGRGLVVDISDFLKVEPCMMWDDLKRAYTRIYKPFLSKRPVAIPEWVMNSVRRGYRFIRSSSKS
ncbi:protein kinase-like protein [Paenibacillus cellulosilyticus]|uniref:Protein kinase-like protein n=1 Tax=Paenibacillus cellulosilyticus TaxID=375489 RepID=A0A2V2YTF0_9BACL|nr:protein kinase family protein [Paenibacillus cellulosilyticus]PWW02829.1 protein kinase-like protein [Paenibacillus cellulosilyticus]QKS45748.1 protein kinase family protein [Paenibacillus cellulosilyticus]